MYRVCRWFGCCITSSQRSLSDRVGHFSTGRQGLCGFSLRYVAKQLLYCSRYNVSLPSNCGVRVNNCIVTCWSIAICQQFVCLLSMVTSSAASCALILTKYRLGGVWIQGAKLSPLIYRLNSRTKYRLIVDNLITQIMAN